MKKQILSPEDFDSMISYPGQMDAKAVVAHIANTKLEKLMESWPVIMSSNENAWWYRADETVKFSAYPTHQARLAFIEPIKRECVKHEAEVQVLHDAEGTIFFTPGYGKCKHCGVELEATWKVKGSV